MSSRTRRLCGGPRLKKTVRSRISTSLSRTSSASLLKRPSRRPTRMVSRSTPKPTNCSPSSSHSSRPRSGPRPRSQPGGPRSYPGPGPRSRSRPCADATSTDSENTSAPALHPRAARLRRDDDGRRADASRTQKKQSRSRAPGQLREVTWLRTGSRRRAACQSRRCCSWRRRRSDPSAAHLSSCSQPRRSLTGRPPACRRRHGRRASSGCR